MKNSSLKTSHVLQMLLFAQVIIGGLLLIGPLLSSRGGADAASAQIFFAIRSASSSAMLVIALIIRGGLGVNKNSKWIIAWMAWLLASCLWSVKPAITLRAGLDFIIIACSMTVIISGLSREQTVRVLLNVLAVLVLVSALLALVFPSIGLTTYSEAWGAEQVGAWKGIFVEKNGLGGTSAIALAAMLGFWRQWTLSLALKAVAVASAALCLVFAQSANAWVGLLSITVMYALLAGRPSRAWVAITWMFVGGTVLLFATTPILPLLSELFGRDASMSGRSGIWTTSLDAWRDAWITGHGYAAGTAEYLQPILLDLYGSAARHAHSGYIEALVETGIVGFTLLVLTLWFPVWRTSYKSWWMTQDEARASSVLQMILFGSLVMAGGDVNATRLIGGWGALTWAAVISSTFLSNARGHRRGQGRADEENNGKVSM